MKRLRLILRFRGSREKIVDAEPPHLLLLKCDVLSWKYLTLALFSSRIDGHKTHFDILKPHFKCWQWHFSRKIWRHIMRFRARTRFTPEKSNTNFRNQMFIVQSSHVRPRKLRNKNKLTNWLLTIFIINFPMMRPMLRFSVSRSTSSKILTTSMWRM